MKRLRIAIITGASSGLGKEFAMQLDRALGKTDEIWLLARNKKALEELSATLRHKARPLAIDLTDKKALAQFAEVLAIQNPCVTTLVNCAGTGGHKAFAAQSWQESIAAVQLNVAALTHMTSICLPYLRRGSKVIQAASAAAFLPQPGFAVYAATKAYVYSFSRALAIELKEKGIIVTALCPGPVDTPFLERAYGDKTELSLLKRLSMENAARVVACALRDAKRGRAVSLCGLSVKALYFGTQGAQNLALCLTADFLNLFQPHIEQHKQSDPGDGDQGDYL